MAQPTLAQVHIDQALTNMSIAYMQTKPSLARTVFPVVPVNKKSGLFFTFNKGDQYRNEAKRRAPGGTPAEGGWTASTGTFNCQEWSYRHLVPDEVRVQSDFDIDRAAVGHVSKKLQLAEDLQFSTTYMTTGVWGTDFAPTTRWDQPGATPVSEVATAKQTIQASTEYEPNTMVIARDVLRALQQSPDIRSRLAITKDQIITTDFLQNVFDVERVIVADHIYNTAAEGQTATMAYFVTACALLCYVAPAPAIMEPSAGYMFSWSDFDNVSADGAAAVARYRHWDEGVRSDYYGGWAYEDMRVTGTDCGYFFGTLIN